MAVVGMLARKMAGVAAVGARVGSRQWLHASAAAGEVFTMDVPAMGDSITEGIIESLLKQPGDAVAVDEVIATIETDKVVVDVRSPVAGVLVSFAAAEGEDVVVGAQLAQLDADAEAAAAAAAAAPAPAPTPAPAPAPAAAAPAAPAPAVATGGRKPSIKFRHGKANTATAVAAAPAPTFTGVSPVNFDELFPSTATVDYLDLPPMYGRPAMSEAEMAAIDSGGAE